MKKEDIYTQAQINLRATDEMSFRLIGLVPLTTLLTFIGAFFKEPAGWNQFLYFTGVIGSLVVFGIYRWELRNIQNCYKYCNIIDELEKGIPELEYIDKYRKPQLLSIAVGKTQAEKLIYSVLVLSWLVLPFILHASTDFNDEKTATAVYIGFCILMLILLVVSGFSSAKQIDENKRDRIQGKNQIID